jgi:hypothetical protein
MCASLACPWLAAQDAEMGEIVNLRRVKKQRARLEAEQKASENRVRHGRTSAAKQADEAEERRRRELLEQARLDIAPER